MKYGESRGGDAISWIDGDSLAIVKATDRRF